MVVLNLEKTTFSSSALLFALSDCLMNTCQQFLCIRAAVFFSSPGGLLQLIVLKGGNQIVRKPTGLNSLTGPSASIACCRRVVSMSFLLLAPHF